MENFKAGPRTYYPLPKFIEVFNKNTGNFPLIGKNHKY